MAANSPRPLRADAVRNRRRILDAAADTFAESGTEASLEEVARRADVGIGTLYRHFPTRASLIEHVYRSRVDELCETAQALLATLPPLEALEEWVLSFTIYVGQKRGMVAALRAALGDEPTTVFSDTQDKLSDATTLLFDAARRDGVIRKDIAPMVLLRAVSGVCMAGAGIGQGDPADRAEQTKSMLNLVLDGLRYGAPA
jgi:AcrR family transcriptional regulator